MRSGRQQKLYRPIHIFLMHLLNKTSKWVTRREMMKIGSIAQCHPLRWLQQKGWLMPCFPMWLLFVVGKYFWLYLFLPFSFSSLTSIQRCQSAKWLPVVSLQADFLYDQHDTIKCFFKSFHFNRQKGFIGKKVNLLVNIVKSRLLKCCMLKLTNNSFCEC